MSWLALRFRRELDARCTNFAEVQQLGGVIQLLPGVVEGMTSKILSREASQGFAVRCGVEEPAARRKNRRFLQSALRAPVGMTLLKKDDIP
jgi:hypothetical protein